MGNQKLGAIFLIFGAVIAMTTGLSLRKKRQAAYSNWGYGPSTYSPTPSYTQSSWGGGGHHWGGANTPAPWSHAGSFPAAPAKPKPSKPAPAPAVHNPLPQSMLQGMYVDPKTANHPQANTAMMQAALQLKWANPIYQSQAQRAGDAFTFNTNPVRNGYKGQRCPPGIKQETCLYNPCPLCRDSYRIVCWTNPCGGCTGELYTTTGQRIYDCETI